MKTVNDYLQWSATLFTLLGAVFTSLNTYPINVVAFNVGGVLWLLYAVRLKHNSLIVTNAGLLLIYVLGLIKVIL